ncbi:MAG: hypothetical protein MO853_04970 [Candidatus Protistobacter heckmanni]|nr:hypothetical protein [Candidatus Protistobacter heckmanni]
MKRIAESVAALAAAMGCSLAFSQSVPEIPFDSVPNPVKMPKNMYLGEVSGIALNSKGHIFVLNRGNTNSPAYSAAATQLLEFDAKANFIREIGKNLYAWSYAHMVRVDKSDNIWVTDKGSDMVIKFSPEGKVLMVFGRKQEASDKETGPLEHPNPPLAADDGRFRQVTDVAWDAAGNSYISDGYINSRVAKADKDGNWLKSWGDRGNKPGELHTPHPGLRRRGQGAEDHQDQRAFRRKHQAGHRQEYRPSRRWTIRACPTRCRCRACPGFCASRRDRTRCSSPKTPTWAASTR